MGISADINGNDLIKALRMFPKNIQRNVMVGATRAAANVVRDRARELVPKRTRNLEKSIVSIQRSNKEFSVLNPNTITFSVTPQRGATYDGWYAHMVENGTVKQVAQPFLRPAFEQSRDKSLEAAKDYIAKRIPEEVMKAKQ